LLEAGGDIHHLAMTVLSFNDHIADMDPYAPIQAPVLGEIPISGSRLLLNGGGALHGIHSTAELGKKAVAH
jgi:hypothetical protein